MFVHETNIRVRYAETDQMGVVYHANYFQYFEVSRAESIRHLGITYADLEKMGVIMPVVDVHCKYIKPALYDELLTVKLTLQQLPQDHKITFHQEVYNEQNELLVQGKVTLYFMNAATMTKSRMPKILYDKVKTYFE